MPDPQENNQANAGTGADDAAIKAAAEAAAKAAAEAEAEAAAKAAAEDAANAEDAKAKKEQERVEAKKAKEAARSALEKINSSLLKLEHGKDFTMPPNTGLVASPKARLLLDPFSKVRYETNIITPCAAVRGGSWVHSQIVEGLLVVVSSAGVDIRKE